MLLAEIEIWHSRPSLPTRRVAIGHRQLPIAPPPGFGGVLLAGVVAAHMGALHPDLQGELARLISDLDAGQRIAQPRLRHRLQVDRIGLARSRHRLVGEGDTLAFDLDTYGTAESQILGAVYAAGQLLPPARSRVLEAVRKATRWPGPVGPSLVAHLSGTPRSPAWSIEAFADPQAWALGVLGFDGDGVPERREVLRRFRRLLWDAHPDHGGDVDGASRRILELTEARRVLAG